MTGWAADRHITPRVITYIAEQLPDIARRHRPTIGNAVSVLHALCRWARREPGGEHDGMWLADDSVGQLEANTGLRPGTIRDVLAALEHIGVTVTVSNGGAPGEHARGATRRLVLDPVDNPRTARAKPAEYRPELRGQSTRTPRAKPRTPRATARDSASSAFTTYPRAGDAGEVSTTNDDGDARITYAEYAAKARADGKRVLTPAVYFAIVGGAPP